MKILLISDVHTSYDKLEECLHREEKNIDAVIFTGDGIDIVEDFEYIYRNIPFYKVAGNIDYMSIEDREKVIEILNKKIFITHGDSYNVKSSLEELKRKAKVLEADIAIYGHTHIYNHDIEDGIHYINSGSVSKEKQNNVSTYSIMNVTEDSIKIELYTI